MSDDSKATAPTFAILGAGNLGPAMAAHLAMNGYDVSLTNRTLSKLEPLQKNNNTIEVSGFVKGEGRLSFVGEFEDAVKGRDVIIICVPANGQYFYAEKLALMITRKTHIILHPGEMFGALEVRKVIEERNPDLFPRNGNGVTISEFESSLLTARAMSITNVEIFAIKQHLGLATLPATRNKEVISLLAPEVYGKVITPRANVLSTGLQDLNAVIHPIVTLLNASAIDRGSPFLYYKEGVTPMVGDFLERCDKERCNLAAALGLEVIDVCSWVRAEYTAMGAHGSSLYELLSSNHAFDTISAPKRLYTRYIWEDLPTGVIPMVMLGKRFGVDMPLMSLVWSLSKAMFKRDWIDEARTLEKLGLGYLSLDQLKEYVMSGNLPKDDETVVVDFPNRIAPIEEEPNNELVITKVSLWKVEMKLKKPYKVSMGVIECSTNVVLRLTASSSRSKQDVVAETSSCWEGWGEADPLAGFTKESVDQVFERLEKDIAPILLGKNPLEIRKINDLLECESPLLLGAVDMALWDLLGKVKKLPVYRLLGGACGKTSFPLLWPFSSQSGEKDVRDIKELRNKGFNTFMLKMGSEDEDVLQQVARVQEINKAFPNDETHFVCVDANQGWSLEQAKVFLAGVEKERLLFVEQPLPATPGEEAQALLHKEFPTIRFSADESVQTIQQVRECLVGEAFDYFSVKVSKNGGITRSQAILHACSVMNKRVLINSMLELGITQAAALHVAAATSSLLPCGHCFMSTLRLVDDITNFSSFIQNGQVHLPPDSCHGLGVVVDLEKLNRYSYFSKEIE
eukprot:CAMPEP_0201490936 /NCGR_PEP_ID=MMETSP0151_2-20130828/27999_1 /ASSEMBLY_ACC=CAM_ASM_000257 /TAXON_ID=200890 /ORGANISM="Paramoeba atlantica, Strain 621/1 / CCAP 1560/9" /LENGTH=796 /DNA_ID=CAMNT_0047877083 /DNA_START=53 /DNA_END=2443 /DNA_ORIENTATION=-